VLRLHEHAAQDCRGRLAHLHVLHESSPEIDDYRLFRDFLRANATVAAGTALSRITGLLRVVVFGIVIGQTGGGKTFVVKCLATRQRMLGRRIVIVDPESNSKYAKVAKEIGGEFALIAPGSPHKINPFDLHDDYLNISLLEDVAEEGDEDAGEAYARARSAALNGKAQEITRMVSLMLSSDSKREEGLSGAEAGHVERAVYEAYARKGITRDPATHQNEPPTFADFFAVLAEYAGNSPEVAGLHEKLYSWHSGALSALFDSQTNVDLSNKFLVFQISKVKGRQKAPVMHAVLEFMNGVLSNPDESAEAGNFELAIMPGETGETLGFVRFYGVTSRVTDRGDQAREAAASFLDYFGGPGPEGDYPVVRQWVERWGLGFGYRSLFDDPDIREQFSEWVDVDTLEEVATTARARRLSEWYPEWDVFTRAELQRAYLGETTADEAAQRIAQQWEELRQAFE
jgi:hypothetical protein